MSNALNLDKLMTIDGFLRLDGSASTETFVYRDVGAARSMPCQSVLRNEKVGINLVNPWRIDNWHLQRNTLDLAELDLKISLDFSKVGSNLHKLCKHLSSMTIVMEIRRDSLESFWILCECSTPAPNNDIVNTIGEGPHLVSDRGFWGYRAAIYQDSESMVINVSDHFAVGQYPRDIMLMLPEIMMAALGLSREKVDVVGLFEQKISLKKLRKLIIADSFRDFFAEREWVEIESRISVDTSKWFGLTEIIETGWRFGCRNSPWESDHVVPIEVMEEREMRSKFAQIDDAITVNKFDNLGQIEWQLLTESRTPFFFRRAIMLSLIDKLNINQEKIDGYLTNEVGNTLFLTGKILTLFSTESAVDLLKPLSLMGKNILEQIPGIETLRVIDMLLTEMLGDCWFSVDYTKALNAYKRVTAKLGLLPPIVAKIIRLARHWNEAQTEVDYSYQYLKIISNDQEIGQVYFRLTTLLADTDTEEAIFCCRKALHLRPWDHAVAMYLASLMLRIEKAVDAVNTLTHTVDNIALLEAPNTLAIAQIKLMIGKIWNERFNRTDLAIERFKDALEILAPEEGNIPILFELEALFSNLDAVKEVALTLEKLLDGNIKIHEIPQVKRIKKALIDMYKEKMSSFEQLSLLYNKLIANNLIEFSEIPELVGLSERYQFDWQTIYDNFHKTGHPQDTFAKIAYHKQMGDIALTYLSDKKAASSHYWYVVELGELNPTILSFLSDYYVHLNQQRSFILSLKRYAEQASGDRRMGYLRVILQYRSFLSEEEVDVILLDMLRYSGGNIDVIKERISEYLANSQADSAFRLTNIAADGFNQNDVKINLYIWAKALFARSTSKERYTYIKHLFDRILAIAPEPAAIVMDAVETLYEDPAKQFVDAYIEKLLDFSRIPLVPRSYMEEHFSANVPVIAKYYYLRITAGEEGEDFLDCLHRLIDFIQNRQVYVESERNVLAMLGEREKMTGEQIERLEQLTQSNSDNVDLERVLLKQVEISGADDNERKIWLLYRQARLYEEVFKDEEKLTASLNDIIAIDGENLRTRIDVSDYFRRHKNTFQAKKLAFYCLDQATFWDNDSQVRRVTDWMVNDWDEKNIIMNVTRNVLQTRVKNQEWDKAKNIAKLMLEYDIHDAKSSLYALETMIQTNDAAILEETWENLLQLISGKEVVHGILDDCFRLFENTGKIDYLKNLMQSAYDHKYEDVETFVIDEVGLYLGAKLLSIESDEQNAFAILFDYFEKYPDVEMCWMPLYFLAKARNHSELILALLEKIIPQIEMDEDRFGQFPVTIESLKDEMIKLGGVEYFERFTMSAKVMTGIAASHVENSFDGSSKRDDNDEEEDTGHGDTGGSKTSHSEWRLATDWRNIVMLGHTELGMVGDALDGVWENDVEKHVAVQIIALLTGEQQALKKWIHQVWRQPADVHYPCSAKDRVSKEEMVLRPENVTDELMRLLTSFMVRQHKEALSLSRLGRMLNMTNEEIVARRQHLAWDSEFFDQTMLRYYTQILSKMRFVVFSLRGLGRELFYDERHRSLYFDSEYYRHFPVSHIFHRIMLLFRSVLADYYIWLQLDIKKEIIPTLEIVKEAFSGQFTSSIMSMVGLRPGIKDIAAGDSERERIRGLILARQATDPHRIEKSRRRMMDHLLKMQLAETLDLVGLAESILECNIERVSGTELLQMIAQKGVISELIKYAVRLKLDQ